MLYNLLNGVIPVFAIGALGFILGRHLVFDFKMALALSKFVMFIAMPALAFQLLANVPLDAFNLVLLGGYLITELIMYAAGFLTARLIFKTDVMEAALLGLAISLTNHILFVLPIATNLFGEAAVMPMVAIISMDGLLAFSGSLILMDILASRGTTVSHTISKILRNPPLIAIALGLTTGSLGISLPSGFNLFVDFLGGTASPVLLFALGIILSQKSANKSLMLPVILSGLKLVVHPLLALVIFGSVLQLTPELRNPGVMVATAPCGVMAFMLAMNYGVRVDTISRAIFYSSIASLVTVTLAAEL
jgi:predicted permease